jgi:hypothetical protein
MQKLLPFYYRVPGMDVKIGSFTQNMNGTYESKAVHTWDESTMVKDERHRGL